MKINTDADMLSVAKRLAESGKEVVNACELSEKLDKSELGDRPWLGGCHTMHPRFGGLLNRA